MDDTALFGSRFRGTVFLSEAMLTGSGTSLIGIPAGRTVLEMWNDVRAKLLWDNLPSTIFLTVIKQPVVRHLDVRLVTDCSNSLVRSENVKLKYADQLVDRRLHDCIGVGALHYRSFDSVVFTQIQLSWRGARLFRGAC